MNTCNARLHVCLDSQPTKEEEREGYESLTWQSIIICQNNCHTFAYQQPILFFYRAFKQIRIRSGLIPTADLHLGGIHI